MVDRYHLVGFVLALALVVVLSTSVGTTTGEPDPDDLVEKAADSFENQSLQAIHTQRISQPDGEVIQTVVVQQQASGGGYLEIVDSAGDGGQQVLFNDSTVIRQDLTDDTAVRYEDSVDHLVEGLRTLGATPDEAIDHYHGEYKGTTQIDGRDSYVVELTSPEEKTAGLSLDIDAGSLEYELPIHEATEQRWSLSRERWWIDKETFYPIKQQVEWIDKDGTVIANATRQHEELAVGPDTNVDSADHVAPTNETELPDNSISRPDLSELETEGLSAESGPDSEPTVVEPSIYESRHTAQQAVPFDLPAVEVPTSYAYVQSVVRTQEERHSLRLLYTHERTDTRLSVQAVDGESSPFQHDTAVRSEDLSAFDGKLVVTDSGTEVVRECDDLTYRVRGPPEAETLIQVMESIEC